MMGFKCLLLLSLCALLPRLAFAYDFDKIKLADGLGVPWGMVFIDNNKLLLTDRAAKVFIVDVNKGSKQRLRGLPEIHVSGQGGLLDVASTPEDPDWIYFTYSIDQGGRGVTELAKAKLKGNQLTHWKVLLSSLSAFDSDRHYGSRIAFDGKGHVFFSIGDRGERSNGQNLSTHAGSIVRLNLDGSVPKDNPFVGRKNALPEIWSYGHRNPQGLFHDHQNHQLWSIEHGPRGGDEINLILKGRNYGWPIVSHGKEYWGPFAVGESTSKLGMEDPRKVYIPSIAPSGLMRYSGKVFKQWQDNLFTGALKLAHLNRVVLDKNNQGVEEHRLFEELGQRIRNVIEGPDGLIYFTTDSGELYRVQPK